MKTGDIKFVEQIRRRADAFDTVNGRQPNVRGRKAASGGRVVGGVDGHVGVEGNSAASGSRNVQNDNPGGSRHPGGSHRLQVDAIPGHEPPMDQPPRLRAPPVRDTQPTPEALETHQLGRPTGGWPSRQVSAPYTLPPQTENDGTVLVQSGPDGETRKVVSYFVQDPDVPLRRTDANMRSARPPENPAARTAAPFSTTGRNRTPTFAALDEDADPTISPTELDEEILCETICQRCAAKGLVCTRMKRRNACEECTATKFKCSNVPNPVVPKAKRKVTEVDDEGGTMESESIIHI